MGEFDLIARYFKRPARTAVLGVGDDCALLALLPGHHLAVSTDTLVEGRHFLPTVHPAHLGHKALAVNLSDLAACGAQPRAFLLSLTLPRVDEDWLSGFAQGLWALADTFDCELIGGDTTQGPLNINITVMGEVPAGQALLRSGAKVGDDIYVSGTLGDARVALEVYRCLKRCTQPPDRAWSGLRPASLWARLCGAWPRQRRTSATACWATWGISSPQVAWGQNFKPKRHCRCWLVGRS